MWYRVLSYHSNVQSISEIGKRLEELVAYDWPDEETQKEVSWDFFSLEVLSYR